MIDLNSELENNESFYFSSIVSDSARTPTEYRENISPDCIFYKSGILNLLLGKTPKEARYVNTNQVGLDGKIVTFNGTIYVVTLVKTHPNRGGYIIQLNAV